MTDEHDPHDEARPDPFPAPETTSPFPPLEDGLTVWPRPEVEAEAPPVPDAAVTDPVSDWNAGADAHDLPTLEHRLSALHRFAFPPAPPLDDEGVAARDRRWTSRTLVLLTLFMLVFNAASIQNWSRQQAPGWLSTTVQGLADVWAGQVAQLGADQPRTAVRDAYEGARDQRFIGQAAAGNPAADTA
tara:strand:- start:1091 stop:1651 length:561 start_codon:yes stop_codon:yes gene_type:complete